MAAEEPTFYDDAFANRIRRLLGDRYEAARPRLERMGRLAAGKVDALAALADRNGPELVCWDRNGDRIDDVRYHASYEEMRRIVYGEGTIAGAYAEPKAERDPHALTFALGHLFGMAEAGLYCPVCMTDGAARVIERFAPPALVKRYVPRLGARVDAEEGCMWLTERQGGSDVGANE
ncbi:MAG TPA: hypothetical protein VHF22_14760, partial [Planctomycetota bacterium]|nr:hypothetical protein [Planctomycetota bacterium]